MNKNTMNILIPIIGFGKTGGYRVLSELANKWIELGHNVSFLCAEKSDVPYYPTKANIIWIDFKGNVVQCNNVNIKYKFKIFSVLYSIYQALQKIKVKFDIVLANQSLTTFPVNFARITAKKYYYIQAYEPALYYKFKHLIFKIMSWYSYKFDIIKIVNAPFYLKYKGIKTDKYVFPGLDLAKYKPIKNRNYSVLSRPFVIGCIGRVEPNKGTREVIAAYKILKKKLGDQIILKIAFGYGGIPDIEGLEIVQPHGDNKLADYYRSIDVMVAPCRYQVGAVHYPVIEAMACGTPVITTGYVPANESNSWIVPVNSPNKIAEALENIMLNENNNVEIKVNNALQEISQFSWDTVASKMIKYFQH